MNSPNKQETWIGRSIGYRQRYRLLERLGGGGMGDVFLAMDTLLGKQVALKLVKDTLVAAEDLRKRFEREVEVCAALKSDHIVELSDYGVTPEGHPFYVMEYLRGETLGQLLRRTNRLSAERTVSIITQVCEGLHLAHEGVNLWRDGPNTGEHIKVVHRDLKPDNIFLVPTVLGELVKILDFGIAKIRNATADHTQLTNMFIGTYHYASPEQLRVRRDLDGRADIYSLGMILYEMLSGTDAFGLGLNIRNISAMSWASAHTSKQPTPLRLQPGLSQLSPKLEAVVMRCLQKAPEQRFASVDELKQALVAAVAATHPPIPPEQASSDPIEPLTPTPLASRTPIPQQLTPKLNQTRPSSSVVTGDLELDASPTQVSAPPPSTSSSRPEIPSNNVPLPGKFPLRLTGAGIAIAITVTGTAYTYLRGRPVQTKILDGIRAELAEAKYGACINKAKTVSANSSFYVKAQELLNQCQLEQAGGLAAESNFADAIAAVDKIPKDSPLYSKAQNLSKQWSNRVITLATAQFQAGKLDDAIAQLQAIPTISPAHQQAQEKITQWRKNWQAAETRFSTAKSALEQGKWQIAIDESNKVPNISFWKNKIKPLVQSAKSQIAQAQAQAQAQRLSESQQQKPTDSFSIPARRYSRPLQSVDSERGWEDAPSNSAAPPDTGWENDPSNNFQSGGIPGDI